MFEIKYSAAVKAPLKVVWSVIMDTKAYSEWNEFVPECDTTFEPGTPIKMKVRLGSRTINQTEMIYERIDEQLIDYRSKLALRLLETIRQHRLCAEDENTVKYESVLIIKGFASPIVKLLFGRQLSRGFAEMTDGIKKRAELLLSRED